MCFVHVTGALDLFDCDGKSCDHLTKADRLIMSCSVAENGQPRYVVESLVPKWNNFVFFDVNAVSFHQVCSHIVTTDTMCHSGLSIK